MKKINVHMVDLLGQYSKIKSEIDANIISSIESGRFINGPIVKEFSKNLKSEVMVMSTLEKKSINKVKARLISYAS